jgi:hypothetical protein
MIQNKIDITKVSSAAVLGNLTISMWGAERIDRSESQNVARSTGAERRAAVVTKKLVDRSHPLYRAVCSAAEALRTTHKGIGMAWDGKSKVLIPNEKIESYLTAMANHKRDFDNAVNIMASSMPAIREESKDRLGSMYNPDEFPTESELLSLCSVKFNIEPVPTSGHFSFSFATEVFQDAAQEFEARIASQFSEGLIRESKLLLKDVQDLAENLGKSGHEGMIKETMISRPVDLAKKIRALNIMGNPEVDKVCERIEHLAMTDVKNLRVEGSARNAAAREAASIARKLSAVDFF